MSIGSLRRAELRRRGHYYQAEDQQHSKGWPFEHPTLSAVEASIRSILTRERWVVVEHGRAPEPGNHDPVRSGADPM